LDRRRERGGSLLWLLAVLMLAAISVGAIWFLLRDEGTPGGKAVYVYSDREASACSEEG